MEKKKVRIVIEYDPDNENTAVQVTPTKEDGGNLHESYQGFKKAYDRMEVMTQRDRMSIQALLQNLNKLSDKEKLYIAGVTEGFVMARETEKDRESDGLHGVSKEKASE